MIPFFCRGGLELGSFARTSGVVWEVSESA